MLSFWLALRWESSFWVQFELEFSFEVQLVLEFSPTRITSHKSQIPLPETALTLISLSCSSMNCYVSPDGTGRAESYAPNSSSLYGEKSFKVMAANY